MVYKIQELSLGGILDQAIAIVKNHFGLLFTIMLLLLVPFMVLQGIIMTSTMPVLPPQPTIEDFTRVQAEQAARWPVFVSLGLVNLCLVYPLTNAAVIHAVARLYLGQPVTAVGAFKHALGRLLPLLGTTLLMMLAIWGGLILCVIPGIYFSIWFGLSQHVTVIEEIAGPAALRRSKQLVNPQRGKFLALAIIVMVISAAANSSAYIIPQVHFQVVANSLMTGVTTMFWTAVFVVFYFSARCAFENFDLHYLAEAIGADAEPPLATPDGMR